MRVESKNVRELLMGNTSPFFIPPFQRSYAWGKPELSRFFHDITRLLESELSGKEPKLQHFFGTLVVKREYQSLDKDIIIVVDGQQRITTTLLFLLALRDTFPMSDDEREGTDQAFFYSSDSKYEEKIKLKQVTADWDCYKAIVTGKKAPSGLITNAYTYFCRELKALMQRVPRLETVHFVSILERINLAVINLENDPYKGEDPQIIFETLNSLGRPLTLSDLIRNYILLGLNSEEQTEAYEQCWFPMIEEKLTRKETSNYLRDFTQYKLSEYLVTASDSNAKQLYSIFKERVASEYEDKQLLILEISEVAHYYLAIVDPDYTPRLTEDKRFNKEVKDLLIDIFQGIKSDPFKSFVMGLLISHQGINGKKKLSDDALLNTLRMIKTYLIRRRVCDLTSGENKNMPLLTKYIPEIANGETDFLQIIKQLPYFLRIPNDKEIRSTLETLPFYNELRNYSKLILGDMEKKRSKVSVDYRDPLITIEHIMPQKLTTIWEQELGEDHQEVHSKYLHNIGNLILTEYNMEISNRSFETKKQKLGESALSYRLDIISVERWDEQAILKHQEQMIQLFLNAYELPDEYQIANNWNERIEDNEIRKFSITDSDAKSFVKFRQPESVTIEGKVYKENRWNHLYFAILQHLKRNYPNQYEVLVNDLTTHLKQGKNPSVINWKDEELYPEIPSFNTRYALVDGTVLKIIPNNYSGDKRLVFYHNRSAEKMIEGINEMFEYFHVDGDEVIITLKEKSN
ncbi:DUF262 domain-containing HNH endonuclease family protein [uncultured Porphyromonas sp.]|uniref:DUF262 domain-containing protein n=1 Tax=uncultured Porphyromonas sp. TaxID=159274 RepID=UPI0025858100|nr:DUF262 domain-containing HNH endonuclease family protein [uncultured Porphyromonas sp.]